MKRLTSTGMFEKTYARPLESRNSAIQLFWDAYAAGIGTLIGPLDG